MQIKRLYCSICPFLRLSFFFFFNDTATTEIYTLSLHDALPISQAMAEMTRLKTLPPLESIRTTPAARGLERLYRSEEHTSELQSQSNLVCRLLLEKKKITTSVTSFGTSTLKDPTAHEHIVILPP